MSEVSEKIDAYHWYDQEWESWGDLRDAFEWEIPDEFNVAEYSCDRWADDRGRVALFYEDERGEKATYTYWELRDRANQMANYLREQGVERGDIVAIAVPEKFEHLVAHVAAWKLGAVSAPLHTHLGTSGLKARLPEETVACLLDECLLDTYREISDDVSVQTVLTVGDVDPVDGQEHVDDALAGRSTEFENVTAEPDETAMIVYTSGTTGEPKGVEIGHQAALRTAPNYVNVANGLDEPGNAVVWSPAPWSTSIVPGILLPALFYGGSVVGYTYDGKFAPEAAFDVIDRYGVTTMISAATTLRIMRDRDLDEYDFSRLQTILVGGEPVEQQLKDDIDELFDVNVNEGLGQTEQLPGVVTCRSLGVEREERLGKVQMGYEAKVVDPEDPDEVVEPGEQGELAIRATDGGRYFNGYLGLPEKTEAKTHGDWVLLEDIVVEDEDGYYSYVMRKDDVLISSGYRINVREIEDCLETHEAVRAVGVIGVDHEVRGTVPKAIVELEDDYDPSADLQAQLQEFVKDDLAKHKYPRELGFSERLPRTSTGSVQRAVLTEREQSDAPLAQN